MGDPCNCELEKAPSNYFVNELWYSYATCDTVDRYTEDNNDQLREVVPGSCPVPPDAPGPAPLAPHLCAPVVAHCGQLTSQFLCDTTWERVCGSIPPPHATAATHMRDFCHTQCDHQYCELPQVSGGLKRSLFQLVATCLFVSAATL